MNNHAEWNEPIITPFQAGLKANCPRCGEDRLYASLLTPAKKCDVCTLDFSFIEAGDGPAVFVILILGVVIVGLALIFESFFYPPLWTQALLWIPLTIFTCIWALRFTKALMIALRYKTKADQNAQIEDN